MVREVCSCCLQYLGGSGSCDLGLKSQINITFKLPLALDFCWVDNSPKGSTTFPNIPTTEDQVFKHMNSERIRTAIAKNVPRTPIKKLNILLLTNKPMVYDRNHFFFYGTCLKDKNQNCHTYVKTILNRKCCLN